MNKAVLWIVILVIVLGGIYWAMMDSSTPSVPAEPTPAATEEAAAPALPAANTLVVGDQVAGKEVVVTSLTLKEDASIVVHKDAKGAPGAVIGTMTLKAGSYTNVKVALTEATKAGDTVYPMLHPDDGDGKYVPDEEGTPLKDAAGNILFAPVKVK